MIAFPFHKDMKQADMDQEIKQSVYLILFTYPKERVMNPTFGCRIKDYVFESITPDIEKEMEKEILSSLLRWEPRIYDINVCFEEECAQLFIHLSYSIQANHSHQEVVFAMSNV